MHHNQRGGSKYGSLMGVLRGIPPLFEAYVKNEGIPLPSSVDNHDDDGYNVFCDMVEKIGLGKVVAVELDQSSPLYQVGWEDDVFKNDTVLSNLLRKRAWKCDRQRSEPWRQEQKQEFSYLLECGQMFTVVHVICVPGPPKSNKTFKAEKIMLYKPTHHEIDEMWYALTHGL